MSAALKFRQSVVPRQNGEISRLKVIQGPDAGNTFVITQQRVGIGRGEDNQIVLTDLKCSRLHAEISLRKDGSWIVRDMGSSNGILHNGNDVNFSALKSKDTVSMGETVFEFIIPDQVNNETLEAAPRSLAQIHAEQAAYEAQRRRVISLGRKAELETRGVSDIPGITATPKPMASKKSTDASRLLVIAVMGGAAYYLLGQDTPPKPKTGPKNEQDFTVASPGKADAPEAVKSIEMFLKIGLREFRAKNYLRAKQSFQNVLQVIPNHAMAEQYVRNCDQAIEEEVSQHREQAKNSQASGKFKAAKFHYEAIIRLLFRDPNNPAYVEAKDQLEVIKQKMSGGST